MSFGAFLTGSVMGGSLVFASLSYHFLRTDEGVELVPKASPNFAETYLDIRDFTPNDWAGHKTVANAVVTAKKERLFEAAVANAAVQAAPFSAPAATSAPFSTAPGTTSIVRQSAPWSALPTR